MDTLIKVGQSRFKLAEAYRFSGSCLQDIPYKDVIYTAARYGGPIAITSHPWAQVLLTSETEIVLHNILIIYPNGTEARQIPKSELHRALVQKSKPLVVGMGFLPDEYLFVMSKQGIYNIINPYTGEIKAYSLGDRFADENIIEAQVCQNSVIFYTSYKSNFYRFYLIKEIDGLMELLPVPVCDD